MLLNFSCKFSKLSISSPAYITLLITHNLRQKMREKSQILHHQWKEKVQTSQVATPHLNYHPPTPAVNT